MRVWLLVLVLAGCDRVFGIGDPYEDAAPVTGPHDVQPLDIAPPLDDMGGGTAASLIVWYPFGGNLMDSTGTRPATPTGNNTVTATGGPFPGSGWAGLDGTGCFTFPIPETPATFSIVFWAESSGTVTAAAPLLSRPDVAASATEDWAFIGNNAEVDFHMYDGASVEVYPIMQGIATSWHQFAVTFDGVHMLTYADGVMSGPGGPGAILYGTGKTIYLGCDGSGGSTPMFAGRFSELQIYSGVLTDVQIHDLAADPTPP